MHEIPRRVLVPIPSLLGMDFSITNEVLLLWTAALMTFLVLAAACRRKHVVPRGPFQNLVEALIQFVERSVVTENIGPKGAAWAPFLLTLFFFILFSNLLGLIPLPTIFKAITSNINVTVALAVMVFAITIVTSVHHHGWWGFLKKFKPAGVSPWSG